jgi:hypothetical protein
MELHTAIPPRPILINVRVSAEEREHLRANAARRGMSVSAYLREQAIYAEPQSVTAAR